ncbi:hypothetical protein J6590_040472 [Homalodisca vitripennis]|nr:hypothetical protein J6590_040472 [Homalodisca vitripennis]
MQFTSWHVEALMRCIAIACKLLTKHYYTICDHSGPGWNTKLWRYKPQRDDIDCLAVSHFRLCWCNVWFCSRILVTVTSLGLAVTTSGLGV